MILATSRTVLGLRAEREYPVPPLPLPADPAGVPIGGAGGLAGGGAVRGPGPRGAPRLRPHRGQRGGGGGDLPAAGRPAAGDRAGGRPHPAARPGRAAAPAGQVAGRAGDRRGGPARAAAHPAGHGGVERGAAGRRRAVAAGGRGGVRGRLDRRGRRPGGRPGRGPGAGPDRGAGPAQPGLPRPRRRRPPAADAGDHPRVRGRAAGGPAGRRRGRAPARRLLPGAGRAGRPAAARRRPARVVRAPGGRGRAIWPPPCAGTSATTPGRCPTCSGSCGSSGSCGTIWARPAPGSAQLLPAAGSFDLQAQAELAWTAAATGRRGGRRRSGAGGPRAPGAAARRDRGPLPPRCVPAGHGVDLGDRRRLRRRPAGGVGLAWSSSVARTSRSGRRWPPTPPASWR